MKFLQTYENFDDFEDFNDLLHGERSYVVVYNYTDNGIMKDTRDYRNSKTIDEAIEIIIRIKHNFIFLDDENKILNDYFIEGKGIKRIINDNNIIVNIIVCDYIFI